MTRAEMEDHHLKNKSYRVFYFFEFEHYQYLINHKSLCVLQDGEMLPGLTKDVHFTAPTETLP